MGLVEDCTRLEAEKQLVESRLEAAVRNIVMATAAELLERDDPEEVLERYIQENGLDRGRKCNY